jgi:hypothetical protein
MIAVRSSRCSDRIKLNLTSGADLWRAPLHEKTALARGRRADTFAAPRNPPTMGPMTPRLGGTSPSLDLGTITRPRAGWERRRGERRGHRAQHVTAAPIGVPSVVIINIGRPRPLEVTGHAASGLHWARLSRFEHRALRDRLPRQSPHNSKGIRHLQCRRRRRLRPGAGPERRGADRASGGSRSFNQRQMRSHQGRGREAGRLPQAVERPFRALGEQ